jgi:5-methylcytosine-specific restriction protein A
MTGRWAGSTRGRSTGTAPWRRLRQHVLDRDNRICHLCGTSGADAVDHITPVASGGGDDESNLAAVHDREWPHCHRTKSSQEGGQAAATIRAQARRPAERHPGLLP